MSVELSKCSKIIYETYEDEKIVRLQNDARVYKAVMDPILKKQIRTVDDNSQLSRCNLELSKLESQIAKRISELEGVKQSLPATTKPKLKEVLLSLLSGKLFFDEKGHDAKFDTILEVVNGYGACVEVFKDKENQFKAQLVQSSKCKADVSQNFVWIDVQKEDEWECYNSKNKRKELSKESCSSFLKKGGRLRFANSDKVRGANEREVLFSSAFFNEGGSNPSAIDKENLGDAVRRDESNLESDFLKKNSSITASGGGEVSLEHLSTNVDSNFETIVGEVKNLLDQGCECQISQEGNEYKLVYEKPKHDRKQRKRAIGDGSGASDLKNGVTLESLKLQVLESLKKGYTFKVFPSVGASQYELVWFRGGVPAIENVGTEDLITARSLKSKVSNQPKKQNWTTVRVFAAFIGLVVLGSFVCAGLNRYSIATPDFFKGMTVEKKEPVKINQILLKEVLEYCAAHVEECEAMPEDLKESLYKATIGSKV